MPSWAGATRHVRVELLSEANRLGPKESVRIALRETIAPGWHTYWINPGDSGQPLHVKWMLPPGWTMSPPRWPAPSILKAEGLTSFGYLHDATLLQTLTPPPHWTGGIVTVKADTETLVCKDICIPEFDHLSLTLGQNGTDARTLINDAEKNLPRPLPSGPLSFDKDGARLVLHWPGDIPTGTVTIFPYDWGMIDISILAEVSGRDLIMRAGPLGDKSETMHVLVDFTNRDGHAVYDVTAMRNGVTPGRISAVKTPSLFAARTASSLPAALVLALLGGLILNLMPCVFPVLSIKALSLVRMNDQDRGHARAHGIAYTCGILLCFAGIAGGLVILKSAGAQIGWGFQLQTPQVVLALSWLLFAIGLSFSGLFEIGAGLMNTGGGLARKEGVAGSFFTGVLAAIVATPCTAPFMGAALGYALLQPAFGTVAVFAALGLGLALPYLLICFSPSLQKMLPRPGRWMVALKEFLAFPMYASSAWLVWVYAMQTGPDGVLYALAGMILLALIVWLTVHLPGRAGKDSLSRSLIYALMGVALSGLLALGWNANTVDRDLAARRGQPQDVSMAGPEKFTPDTLKAALASSDPVFVDMTAAWCITCKINERVALNNPSVKTLFNDRHIRTIVGDWTNQDAAITAYLAGFGREGVPLYVYYGAPDGEGKRPDAVVLPQILTPSGVRKIIAPG